MTLTIGARIGSYEVIAPIGAGGMGEVYRARDTKLGREVAIKVLPETFSQDKERVDRFEREAKLLASLNHPGIATLHGLEHDGQRLTFASLRGDPRNLYSKAADGSGVLDRLSGSELNGVAAFAYTPDGKQLVIRAEGQLRLLSDDGSSEPLVATEFVQRNGELSPDGRWLAYGGNQSGQFEIYVRPFPNVDDGQWQISRNGGRKPLWSPDGDELFYVAPDGKLMSVPIQTEQSFVAGIAEVVLDGNYFMGTYDGPGRTYDVSKDGKSFLMIKESGKGDSSSMEIIVVLNWHQELLEKVPVK